jgi:hypothetical protein
MTHKINTSETQINVNPDNNLGYEYGTILLQVDGDYNTRQLRSYERDGKTGRNIGGITTQNPGSNGAGGIQNTSYVSGQGIGLADGSYTDIGTLSTTSARGFGATFNVTISNSGEDVSFIINNPGQYYKINDTVTLSGANFGSTEGNNIVINVDSLYIGRVGLNLLYQVQKLGAGYYTLDHGHEGQIMYFTPREITAGTAWEPQHCSVRVARARTWSGQTVAETDDREWYPFEGAGGGSGATLVTLMYIEGAWVASGGTWD